MGSLLISLNNLGVLKEYLNVLTQQHSKIVSQSKRQFCTLKCSLCSFSFSRAQKAYLGSLHLGPKHNLCILSIKTPEKLEV